MGTTAQKLEYLGTTKSQLKDQINYGLPTEKQITNTTTFRNYVGSIFEAFLEALRTPDTLFTNLPKTSGSGSQITLNGTTYAPMRITLNPTAISQTTYTGKNLCPNNKTSGTSKGVTFTSKDDGTYTISGTNDGTNNSAWYLYQGAISLTAGTYHGIPTGLTGVSVTAYVTYDNNSTAYLLFSANNVTLARDVVSANIYLQVTKTTTTTFTGQTIYPILSTTSVTADTYEPYVGGTASPNPSYPQDIHTISGDNTIVVEGKNLLNLTDYNSNYSSTTYSSFSNHLEIKSQYGINANIVASSNTYKITGLNNYDLSQKFNFKGLLPNTQYTISCNISTNIASGTIRIFDQAMSYTATYKRHTFTTDSNGEHEYTLMFYGLNGTNNYCELSNIQLELGNIDSPTYEPYKSNTAILNLGDIEYCKIGDYEDRIFKNISGDTDYSSERDNGGWYIKKNIGKVVLDGTESWGLGTTNVFYTSDITDYATSNNTPMSNYFSGVSNVSGATDMGNKSNNTIGFINSLSNYRFYIKSTDFATETAVKNWLSTHNLIVYYILATSTYTKITGELANQLEQVYKGMLSYDGQTNISQVNNDLAFELVGSALEDLR